MNTFLKNFKAYPRHTSLFLWLGTLVFLIILTVCSTTLIHLFQNWQSTIVEDKVTKSQQLKMFHDFNQYLSSPTSFYNQLHQRNLSTPLVRPALLNTLKGKCKNHGLKLKNFHMSPTQSQDLFNVTPFKVHAQAQDDRRLYQLLKDLDSGQDYLWKPNTFIIIYQPNSTAQAKAFDFYLQGAIYKFAPVVAPTNM